MLAQDKQSGFTLIEILIVVGMVGILAAIAYPSYQDYILKSRRADAKVCLSQAAAIQERIFSEKFSYGSSADLSLLACDSTGKLSEAGYYAITVTNSGSGCSGTAPFDCFTLTATALGRQASDTDCLTFSINHLGQETATPDSQGSCW